MKPITPSGRVATAVWDGHVFINLAAQPVPFAEHLAGLDLKFRPWGMESLEARGASDLPPEGQLEARDPELLGVPALSDRPPAPEPPVALHERRQRAASAHLPRRPDGPAGGRRHPEPRRPDEPRAPAGPVARGLPPRLLLRPSPEPPAQPAPRLHAHLRALAPRRGPHGHRLRVVTSIRTRSPSPGSTPRVRSSSGTSPIARTGSFPTSPRPGSPPVGYEPGPYSNREELLLGLDQFVRARVEGTRP